MNVPSWPKTTHRTGERAAEEWSQPVLYLVRPLAPLMWSDLPASLLDMAIKEGADLSNLDWKPATDTRLDEIIVGLALRHGIATSTGIALDGGLVYLRNHPAELVRTHRNVKVAQAAIPESHTNLMEELIPGWKQHGNELDAKIDEGVEKAFNDAVAELRTELDAPIKPEIQELWIRLGGSVPD